MIDGGDGKVADRNVRSHARCCPPHDLNSGVVLIDAVALEPMLQEVDQIPAVAAAGVEHARARIEPAAQQLIEDVDVDVAELRAQLAANWLRRGHAAVAAAQFGAGRPNQIHAM